MRATAAATTSATTPYPSSSLLKKENSPVEGLAYEPAALHGLHERQDLEVGHLLDLIVRRLEEVLLRHQHSLLEEVRVNRQAVLLLDELVSPRQRSDAGGESQEKDR